MDMDMDMGDMDMHSASGDVPRASSMLPVYWAFVGAALAVAALVNLLDVVTLRQRTAAARRGVAEPARPRRPLSTALATATAMSREIVYATLSLPRPAPSSWRTPTLGRAFVVAADLVLVLVLCFYKLDPADQWSWEGLGYRTGWVATAQLPLVYVLAGRNNLVGLLTGTSYERLNWLHRWTARVLLLTVTLHLLFWFRDWARYDYIAVQLATDHITRTGFAAWCILAWIVLSSFAPLRRWNYELFVVQHVVTVAGFSAAVYLHLPPRPRQMLWISIAFALFDRLLRACLVLYANVSVFRSSSRRRRRHGARRRLLGLEADLEPLAGGFTRITVRDPPTSWAAGQHVFLSCHSIVPLQSHPFTVASLPSDGVMQFLVRSHAGATRTLNAYAEGDREAMPLTTSDDVGPRCRGTTVTIEGPYGRVRPLRQFDSVVFLAGSTGGTFTTPLMRDLVRSWTADGGDGRGRAGGFFRASPASATKYVRFVWVLRSRDQLSWFAKELNRASEDVAALRGKGLDVELRISIYITCDEAMLRKPGSLDVDVGAVAKQTCGPQGTCCCTALVGEKEKGDDDDDDDDDDGSSTAAAAECRCNCEATAPSADDVPSKISSSSSSLSPGSMDKEAVTVAVAVVAAPEALHPSVSVLSGRPRTRSLIRGVLERARGESAVVVCGPRGLVDDARASVVALSDERAVHKGTGAQGIYLHAEAFGL